MKTLFCVVILGLVCSSDSAQGKDGLPNTNFVGWNNVPTNIQTQKVDYSDIKGNCFWNTEWLKAKVIMGPDVTFGLEKAKLNLYSNSIHFIDKYGMELSTKDFKAIEFYAENGTTKLAVFKWSENKFIDNKEGLVQILADGNFQLQKVNSVKLQKKETDPLLKTVELSFDSKESYYINYNGKLEPLKGISKNSVFSIIPKTTSDDEWLKSKKNKLKSEAELVAFLNYKNEPVN
ncbi:MAG: hypothetical protein QM734_01710 [Cyclobacteriaceae bacterium]